MPPLTVEPTYHPLYSTVRSYMLGLAIISLTPTSNAAVKCKVYSHKWPSPTPGTASSGSPEQHEH